MCQLLVSRTISAMSKRKMKFGIRNVPSRALVHHLQDCRQFNFLLELSNFLRPGE